MTRTFPIVDNDIPAVPFALMAAHGARALVNHGQTVARLADRGGVSAAEAVAIIEDRAYMVMPLVTARERLREYARAYEVHDADARRQATDLATRMRDNPSSVTRYNFNKLIALIARA